MKGLLERIFHLRSHETSSKQELLAGTTSFFTIVYIMVVNAAILADAGIPLEAGILATVFTSFVGCLIMAFRANAPIILVPGMGVNAFFTFTIVHGMGLSWQEALGAVFMSGVLFAITAFTPLAKILSDTIPKSLKEAITVGIGVFLAFIGLQKGGLVVANTNTAVAMGDLHDPHVIATTLTLVIAVILFIRNIKGNFLLTIAIGTIIAWVFGILESERSTFSISDYASVFGAMSFARIADLTFWMATFSLSMVLIFENMGLLHGMLEKKEKFTKAYQANALSVLTCGLLGTSPTVSTVESAAGITAGGKTGLTALTTGVLFLLSLLVLPFVQIIPDNAIAPILIIIGGLMMTNMQQINLQDFSEGFPAFLIIVMIPLTYSIADGIAFGFIAYPILKLALGKKSEVNRPLYVIASLFLLTFVLHALT
ncbi:NCS2 family permease [Ectobacillus sp. JY-23]|uniref:NCS2 family permease n=1 Tax=Ectobacillus sp. JY-23 TaxID=2933872 RepID=UPI001FF329B8|nr:NCS2 family permease [Ectobacillus sp. JY-23]UOY93866.1 NCS2 family permease [Ectobacillus sp. JY-23]